MQTHFIEACNILSNGNKFNWGKFAVCRFEPEEWERRSAITEELGHSRSLLKHLGHDAHHIWVLDLATREGASFRPGGSPHADLQKHRVWVCPMFEPFLEWLYKQDLSNLSALPHYVEISEAKAEPALAGYRRPGPEKSA